MSNRQLWILSVCGAFAATFFTYWARGDSTPAFVEPVVGAFNIVHRAAVAVSTMLSSSHSPSLAFEYVVLFAIYLLLFLVLLGVLRFASRSA
jgi:hypothetical protein